MHQRQPLPLPGAVQCADRFHLLKNLGEALEGVLARVALIATASRRSQEPSLWKLRTLSPAERETKTSCPEPGEARGALGDIRANRRFT